MVTLEFSKNSTYFIFWESINGFKIRSHKAKRQFNTHIHKNTHTLSCESRNNSKVCPPPPPVNASWSKATKSESKNDYPFKPYRDRRCTSTGSISFNGWNSVGTRLNSPNNMISPRQVQTGIIHFLSGSETLPAEMTDNLSRQSQRLPKLRLDRLSNPCGLRAGQCCCTFVE